MYQPIQAVEWTNEESKARLCPNVPGFVTNPWLLRSEQRMNKWRGEMLRTHSSKEERQAGAKSLPQLAHFETEMVSRPRKEEP